MTQHTPGPWVFKKSFKNVCDMGSIVGPNNKRVAYFGDAEDYYPTEGEAPSPEDMALILAAPNMLKAMEEALFMVESFEGKSDEDDAIVDAYRAAINKAKGEK